MYRGLDHPAEGKVRGPYVLDKQDSDFWRHWRRRCRCRRRKSQKSIKLTFNWEKEEKGEEKAKVLSFDFYFGGSILASTVIRSGQIWFDSWWMSEEAATVIKSLTATHICCLGAPYGVKPLFEKVRIAGKRSGLALADYRVWLRVC